MRLPRPSTRLAASLGALLVATGTVATTTAWIGAEGASEGNAVGTGTIALSSTPDGPSSRGVSSLAATALRPGGSQSTTRVVENTGSLPGTVYLRPRRLDDAAGGPLADALKLEVERCADAACTAPTVVYAARLGERQCQALAALEPGQDATFRLTVRWPADADDSDLYGAALDQPLRWILRTGELADGCAAPLAPGGGTAGVGDQESPPAGGPAAEAPEGPS